MPEDNIKHCQKCGRTYQTILDTCVYCMGRMRPVSQEGLCGEIFAAFFSVIAVLVFVLVSSFSKI